MCLGSRVFCPSPHQLPTVLASPTTLPTCSRAPGAPPSPGHDHRPCLQSHRCHLPRHRQPHPAWKPLPPGRKLTWSAPDGVNESTNPSLGHRTTNTTQLRGLCLVPQNAMLFAKQPDVDWKGWKGQQTAGPRRSICGFTAPRPRLALRKEACSRQRRATGSKPLFIASADKGKGVSDGQPTRILTSVSLLQQSGTPQFMV